MEWNADERLALVAALAKMSEKAPQGGSYSQLMIRIVFLCQGDSEWLELNKASFADIIGISETPEDML